MPRKKLPATICVRAKTDFPSSFSRVDHLTIARSSTLSIKSDWRRRFNRHSSVNVTSFTRLASSNVQFRKWHTRIMRVGTRTYSPGEFSCLMHHQWPGSGVPARARISNYGNLRQVRNMSVSAHFVISSEMFALAANRERNARRIPRLRRLNLLISFDAIFLWFSRCL